MPRKVNLDIFKLRSQIDQLDSEIARLVKKRILLAEAVLQSKKSSGTNPIDIKREAQILARYQKTLGKLVSKPRLVRFLKAMKKLSRLYPQK